MAIPKKPDYFVTVDEEIRITLVSIDKDPRLHLVMEVDIQEFQGKVLQIDMGELDLDLVDSLIHSLTSLKRDVYHGSGVINNTQNVSKIN